MNDIKTDWYFIVNPRAGSGKTMSKWVPAERKLERLGIGFVTEYTDHKKHATSLAYEAAAAGYRRIAAVGGDGSLHETLNGICRFCDETKTPTEEFCLAVIPIGSGNDWIKALNVPNDIDEVVDLINLRSFGRMDVVKVVDGQSKACYMANIGGTGFDSHVCQRVNIQKEGGRRGARIYLNGLLHTITTIKAIKIKVVADGTEVFEGDAYSLAIGNGKYSGGGMRQVPLARIDDDVLDFMIVPKVKLGKIMHEIPRLYNGTAYDSSIVISGHCKTLSVIPLNIESKDIVELDGEIEGRLPISIEMVNRKINVLKG